MYLLGAITCGFKLMKATEKRFLSCDQHHLSNTNFAYTLSHKGVDLANKTSRLSYKGVDLGLIKLRKVT